MTSGLGSRRRHGSYPRMMRAGTLVVLPISVLALARGTTLFTDVSPSTALYRQVTFTVDDEAAEQATSEFLRRQFGDWRQRRETVPEGTRLGADQRIGSIDDESDIAVRRTGTMILHLWTTYSFSEEIRPTKEPRTRREKQLASLATFTYELRMPGRITTTVPMTPDVDGGTARWTLKAADAPMTIKATSEAFKWGNAVVIAYIAVWALGWAAVAVGRRIRARPKRI